MSDRPLRPKDLIELVIRRDTPPGTTLGLTLRFRVKDLFPPDDRLSVPVLMLAGATNDALLLQRLLAQRQRWGREQGSVDQVLMQQEISYFFRMLCGHLYEVGLNWRDQIHPVGGEALDQLRKDEQARVALDRVESLLVQDSHFFTKTLHTFRNEGAFHYDSRAFNRAVNDGTRVGEMIVTGLAGFNRYTVADSILDEVVQKIAPGDPEQLTAQLSEALELADALGTVVGAILAGRIAKKMQSVTVVEEASVMIPPALVRAWAVLDAERERPKQSHDGGPA